MTEVAPCLTRYGDVEKANFFSLAKELLKVHSIFVLHLLNLIIFRLHTHAYLSLEPKTVFGIAALF